jgi:hypothetical protein
MHNFSDQCLDLARSLLGNNLRHINEDGTVTPASGENLEPTSPAMRHSQLENSFEQPGKLSSKILIFMT